MTAPMMPQQPLAPPQPPPFPFMSKPNDGEPQKATIVMRRLSKLFEDPEYAKQPPEWQGPLIADYSGAVQALQPPPVLPKGVMIQAKGDASTIGPEEQAAMHPTQPPVSQQNGSGVMQPSHPTAPQMPR